MEDFFDPDTISCFQFDSDFRMIGCSPRVHLKLQKKFQSQSLPIPIEISQLITESHRDFFLENLQLALEGEVIQRKKSVILAEKEYWFELNFVFIQNYQDGRGYIQVYTKNVSSDFIPTNKIGLQNLEKILSHSPDFLMIINRDYCLEYINRDLSSELIRENLVGKSLKNLFSKADLDIILPEIENAFCGEGTVRFLWEPDKLKGRWFSVQLSPLSESDEVNSILGTVSDITDRILFENKIVEKEKIFRKMADNAPVMIWTSGEDSLCDFFNQHWLKFTGKKMEEEIGSGWADGVHPDDLNLCLKTYLDSFHLREEFEIEYRLRRHDGVYRWILDRAVPYYESEQNFQGYIGTCIDITERKENESQIHAALKEKEILLKEIHHRVKNNLQIISSLLSLQSNHSEHPEVVSALQSGINRIKSISLLHDMLNLSNNKGAIHLKDYIENISNYLFLIHNSNHSNTKIKINSEDILINIDIAIYIGIIINELVANSIKYAFSGILEGEIYVDISIQNKSTIYIQVRDNGIGLPKDFELPKIKSLGLKLVNMLVVQLEGRLEIQTENGVQYKLFIPIR